MYSLSCGTSLKAATCARSPQPAGRRHRATSISTVHQGSPFEGISECSSKPMAVLHQPRPTLPCPAAAGLFNAAGVYCRASLNSGPGFRFGACFHPSFPNQNSSGVACLSMISAAFPQKNPSLSCCAIEHRISPLALHGWLPPQRTCTQTCLLLNSRSGWRMSGTCHTPLIGQGGLVDVYGSPS